MAGRRRQSTEDRLDAQIDQYARSLPDLERVDTWQSPQVQRWHDGYRIVVSEITAICGDGRFPA